MTKDLDLKNIQKIAKIGSDKTDLARRTVTANGIYSSAEDRAMSRKIPQTWNVEIETGGIVTDQQHSGRCWLFASLNLLRHNVERDFKMKDFELSETYNYFFDKLEKANAFLEFVWKYRDEPISSRKNEYFTKPQDDGAYFSTAAKLIDKYGVVPKTVMPESKNTSNSGSLNIILTRILRRGGIKIREISDREKMEIAKSRILADVYRVLSIALGEPPRKFDWSYRDDKKRIHKFSGSPLDFAKKFGLENVAQKYVTLRDVPTLDYGKIYRTKDLWMTAGDCDYEPWLNVELAKIKPLILQQLRDKESVVIYIVSERDATAAHQGVMDLQSYNFANLFDVNFEISRRNRKRSHEDMEDHAVLVVGADAPHGVARWYKVENSWGDKLGNKGFWAMSSAWADEYMTCAVIRRDLLPDEIAKTLEQKPIEIDPWDDYGE